VLFVGHDCRQPSVLTEVDQLINVVVVELSKFVGVGAGGGALEDEGREV